MSVTIHQRYCQITIRGRVEMHDFPTLYIKANTDGQQLLSGPVADRAALLDLLQQLDTVGVAVLAVRLRELPLLSSG